MTGHGDVTFATNSSAEASYESWPNTLLDLRHYSPKMKRPISSPSCFASFGSAAARKRSARAKKAFSFSFCASKPCSTSSTSTRLSLRRLFLAIRSTCSASRVGRVTLLRTCLAAAMTPLYTVMVHSVQGFARLVGFSEQVIVASVGIITLPVAHDLQTGITCERNELLRHGEEGIAVPASMTTAFPVISDQAMRRSIPNQVLNPFLRYR